MQRRTKLLTLAFPVLLSASGCENDIASAVDPAQYTSTGSAHTKAPRATSDIADAPDVSGAVIRFRHAVLYTWVDVESRMRVVIGGDMREFCSGTRDLDVVELLGVSADDRFLMLKRGDEMRTTVWPYFSFDCERFLTGTPLMSGFSFVRQRAEDFIGNGDQSTKVQIISAHGTLKGPNGEDFQLNAYYKANSQTGVATSRISLQ